MTKEPTLDQRIHKATALKRIFDILYYVFMCLSAVLGVIGVLQLNILLFCTFSLCVLAGAGVKCASLHYGGMVSELESLQETINRTR